MVISKRLSDFLAHPFLMVVLVFGGGTCLLWWLTQPVEVVYDPPELRYEKCFKGPRELSEILAPLSARDVCDLLDAIPIPIISDCLFGGIEQAQATCAKLASSSAQSPP